MTQNSGDLRVRRTQKSIREALIALAEERGFDAITVGEIAERAMVSRAAFYRYYQNKYDLVEQIFEEAMHTFVRDVGPPRDLLNNFDPAEPTPELWIRLFEHFAVYEQLYRVLLGGKGSSWFVTKMRVYLADMISVRVQELARYPNMKPIANQEQFVTALIAALLVDTVTWWLEQGKPYTTRQIATSCYHLVFSILKGVTWE